MRPSKRELFELRTQSIIKDLRESQNVTYRDLARRLEGFGVVIDERVLANRINRGGYSFAFGLLVLTALGQKTVDIPEFPGRGPAKE